MRDGAFGVGSALIYPRATCIEAGHRLEALDEAIDIGRKAGVRVEFIIGKQPASATGTKKPRPLQR